MTKRTLFTAILIIAVVTFAGFYFRDGFSMDNETGDAKVFVSEQVVLERYIKNNIAFLVTNELPVLGGAWYAHDIVLDIDNNTGSVVFEDGHISNFATFSYDFDIENQTVNIRDFKVLH